jgi:sugar-specific transcriptional regulator TrmB
MKEHLLEDIGLTKGETKVYLTLLKIGETTTGKIIAEAQISAGKVYQILDRLIKKGLVGYTTKEKTKYFNAASPKRILDLLHEKEKELKEKEKKINQALPSLIAIQKEKRKHYESKFFKGFKGIHTVIFEFLDNLTSQDEIRAMGVETRRDKKYNLMWLNWHRQRIKKKIKCKMIFSSKNEFIPTLQKMKYTEVRVLEGITPATINVAKDTTLIFTYHEEPGCLSILNKDVAASFSTFFDNLWSLGKPES